MVMMELRKPAQNSTKLLFLIEKYAVKPL